jgi:hypothetical protein
MLRPTMRQEFSYGDWVRLCEADDAECVGAVGLVIGRYADDESVLVAFRHGTIRLSTESLAPAPAALQVA